MDTITVNAFFDEFEKIAWEIEPTPAEEYGNDRITADRLKRLALYGGAGALGIGLGYGVGNLVGRPIQKKLLEAGMGPAGAKILSYGVPISAGLGAALGLIRKKMANDLMEKIKGADV